MDFLEDTGIGSHVGGGGNSETGLPPLSAAVGAESGGGAAAGGYGERAGDSVLDSFVGSGALGGAGGGVWTPWSGTRAAQGYHGQNATPWERPTPRLATPQTVLLAPETAELLKTAISSDLQVKLGIQLASIQQSLMIDMRDELRRLLGAIVDEVRTLKRRQRR